MGFPSTHAEREAFQEALIEAGYTCGPDGADGVLGADTSAAIVLFRTDHHMPNPTEPVIDNALVAALGLSERHSNPLDDFLTGLAIQAALNRLKGLPLMNFLSGYKTYIIGGLLIVIGCLEALGIGIPNVTGDPIALIGAGIGLITGRTGAKSDVAKALGGQ